jgi:hypothetical protein
MEGRDRIASGWGRVDPTQSRSIGAGQGLNDCIEYDKTSVECVDSKEWEGRLGNARRGRIKELWNCTYTTDTRILTSNQNYKQNQTDFLSRSCGFIQGPVDDESQSR